MRGWVFLLGIVGAASACGGDTGPDVNADVARFVGTWRADSLTVTNDADTTVVANVLDFGGFFIVIQASGSYTATLTLNGSSSPEIGQLTVNNANTLTLTPSVPAGASPATSSYTFLADDYLVLEGPTEFDFNLDGTPESAQAYFGLQRD